MSKSSKIDYPLVSYFYRTKLLRPFHPGEYMEAEKKGWLCHGVHSPNVIHFASFSSNSFIFTTTFSFFILCLFVSFGLLYLSYLKLQIIPNGKSWPPSLYVFKRILFTTPVSELYLTICCFILSVVEMNVFLVILDTEDMK